MDGSRRSRVFGLSAAVVALLLGTAIAPPPGSAEPAPPSSAVTLGYTASNNVSCVGGDWYTQIQVTGPAGTPYATPGRGVVTSFSHTAYDGGQIELLFYVRGTVANTYQQVARSAPQTVVANSTNTLPVRIPVQAGWMLGNRLSNEMACEPPGTTPAGATMVSFVASDYNPDTQTTTPANPSSCCSTPYAGRLNLSAVWEPDVDGDGYGDVSQDGCPQSALTQAACVVPDTLLTKRPASTTRKKKVEFRFQSTVPESTFRCSFDGAAPTPCESPVTQRLKPGRHSFTVVAVAPFSVTDPTPATATVKVKKPKKKKHRPHR